MSEMRREGRVLGIRLRGVPRKASPALDIPVYAREARAGTASLSGPGSE
jgi:hypothetical protein